MNKMFVISVFLLSGIMVNHLFAQSNEQLKIQLENLKKEKITVEEQITKLQQKNSEINNKIKELETQLGISSSTKTSGGFSGILTKTTSSGGMLREKPVSTSAEIISIPGNTDVLVHPENQGLYFKVTYQGKTGYLNYSSLVSTPEIDKIMLESNKKTTPTDNAKLERLTKLYGKEVATKIVAGLLWEGMSQAQVIESVSRPKNTTKNNTEQGLREVWTYSDKEIVFLNGELKSWEKK